MAIVEGDHGVHVVPGNVPEQLVSVLRAMSSEGVSFEAAWRTAWDRVVWPESERETQEWERALSSTKETWRARYEGWEPTPGELAVAELMQTLGQRPL